MTEFDKNDNISTSSVSTTESSPNVSLIMKKTSLSSAITYILTEIIKDNENNQIKLSKNSSTTGLPDQSSTAEKSDKFKGKKTPSISIENFIKRIIKYTSLENSTLILSLIYLDRYCEIANVKLTKDNTHRLIMMSIITALKFNEDDLYANAFYAKVGGITTEEFNHLELLFATGIQYSLFVKQEVFEKYEIYLNKFNDL